MSEISDEMLMAYADGALDPVQRRLVDSYLQTSQDGAARLAPFLSTGALLQRQLAPMLSWPVPPDLVETIRKAPMATAPAAKGSIAKFAALPKSEPLAAPGFWTQLVELITAPLPFGLVATACTAALLFGGVTGWALRGMPEGEPPSTALVALNNGKFVAAAPLAHVLEAQASKTTAVVYTADGDVSIAPFMTFATHDKHFCRQYDITLATGAQAAGLGCRQTDGTWTIEVHTAVASAAGTRDDLSRPASSRALPAIDAVADTLIDGPALPIATESDLIKNGWRN